VEQLRRIGGYMRVTVRLADGQDVEVECPKSQLDELGITQGDRVRVDVREAKVFVNDYAI